MSEGKDNPQRTQFGPLFRDWIGNSPKGDCPDCGGQCAPECGIHPKGCVFGGPSDDTVYWLIAKGCELYHGEELKCEEGL